MLRPTLRTLSTGALSALLLFSAARAQADMISVASIGTINMPSSQQTGFVNINIFDANLGGGQENLYGWSLGLRVVPLSGAQGTVTIDSASMTYAPNPILTNPFPVSLPSAAPPDPNVNQPGPGDVTVFASDAAFNSVPVPGTQKGMVSVRFNASANARGDFALQLVDSGGLANTYWTDALGDNYALNFAGAPIIGTGGAQIGTITAVPEPSSRCWPAEWSVLPAGKRGDESSARQQRRRPLRRSQKRRSPIRRSPSANGPAVHSTQY